MTYCLEVENFRLGVGALKVKSAFGTPPSSKEGLMVAAWLLEPACAIVAPSGGIALVVTT